MGQERTMRCFFNKKLKKPTSQISLRGRFGNQRQSMSLLLRQLHIRSRSPKSANHPNILPSYKMRAMLLAHIFWR